MKLSKGDIKFLSEGQQIRNAVLEKYRSVEEFVYSNDLIISPDTVKNYMRKKVVTSETFKCNLARILDKHYHEIALSEDGQLARYIDIIAENIEEYKEETDIEVLEYLMDMCLKRHLGLCIAKMYRAIGMHNFYRNKGSVAVEMMKLAINMLESRRENKLLISYLSELGLIYFYEVKYDKAREVYETVSLKLSQEKDIDIKTLFLHYYRQGILYNNTSEYTLARQLFQKSLSYTDSQYYISRAIMNIGLTYKKQGNCFEALNNYRKALEALEESDIIGCSVIYNNIAEVYKIQENYEQALYYSEQAMKALDWNYASYRFLSFFTYCEVKVLQGEKEQTIDKLIELLSEVKDKFIFKKFIVEGIDYIVGIAKAHKDDRMILKLEDLLTQFMKDAASGDAEFEKALYSCMGKILFYKKERSDKFYEKVDN